MFSDSDTRTPLRRRTFANSTMRSSICEAVDSEPLMQVIFVAVARARSLAGFPFGKVGFEFLVRFTNIGFVLHQRGKSLLSQVAIQLFDIEQGQRLDPVQGLADTWHFF